MRLTPIINEPTNLLYIGKGGGANKAMSATKDRSASSNSAGTHYNDASRFFECCGLVFPGPKAYAEHWFQAHPTLPLMCCNRSFISAEDYARHEKVDHDVKS